MPTRENDMISRIFVGCFYLWAALLGTAVAGPREDAAAAYGRGDYAEAFRLWHLLAEAGDGGAEVMLGFMYHDGEGVQKDLVRAYMWFRIAASNLPANQQSFHDANDALDMTAKLMTPEQIAQARLFARRCQEQNYKGCD